MEKIKNIVIGFGKAGKTLAQDLGNRGETTIVIEKDPKMYGGTCINVACIPSKKLATLAKRKPENVMDADYYTKAIQEKKALIDQLNEANYENVDGTENVKVIDGEASFVNDHQVEIALHDGDVVTYEAERIFINTGSRPNIPAIPGLEIDGENIHTSETLMDDEEFPERLAIIGDGYVGLEFASIYAQFGSKVTLLSHSPREEFLKAEDRDVAQAVLEALENMGITFLFDAETTQIDKEDEAIVLTYEQKATKETLQTDKILVAVGRHPNVQGLNLEAADVILAEDESIQINKRLQTNKKHIYALGDVNGGPQHTYLSLDDYRIVISQLFGDGSYDLAERKYIPAATFIHPPLSSVGLTEKEARAHGYEIKVASLPAASIPRAKILDHKVGLYKAVIDADTDQILGTVLFAEESSEVINLIATAMKGKLTYQTLANQVFTHPAMAEGLNDLYGNVE
jgi:pyruvate/2-oxoglutarate dehydrogenase complex dihydrolipoamide dehydrogenase (E3) component